MTKKGVLPECGLGNDYRRISAGPQIKYPPGMKIAGDKYPAGTKVPAVTLRRLRRAGGTKKPDKKLPGFSLSVREVWKKLRPLSH